MHAYFLIALGLDADIMPIFSLSSLCRLISCICPDCFLSADIYHAYYLTDIILLTVIMDLS
jgi:hypothetical protein